MARCRSALNAFAITFAGRFERTTHRKPTDPYTPFIEQPHLPRLRDSARGAISQQGFGLAGSKTLDPRIKLFKSAQPVFKSGSGTVVCHVYRGRSTLRISTFVDSCSFESGLAFWCRKDCCPHGSILRSASEGEILMKSFLVVVLSLSLLLALPLSARAEPIPSGGVLPPAVSSDQLEAVEKLQEEYRQAVTAQEYELAMRAYRSMNENGPSISWLSPSSSDARHKARACISIPRWAVVAYGWYLIAHGALVAGAGGFVDATIVGIPAGAVMNALGIGEGTSGYALLYWADHTSWPKRVCL